MFEEGAQILSEMGSKSFMAILMDGLGAIMQYQGHYDRALAIHTRCLTLAHEMDDQRIIALSLEKLAGVAAGTGSAERTARLLGAAEVLREAIHVPVESIDRPDYERFVAMARGVERRVSVDPIFKSVARPARQSDRHNPTVARVPGG